MPFIIETWDRTDAQAIRARERARHLSYLAEHAGLLLACGAKLHEDGTDAGGGFYVVDVEERDQAEAFIAGDPFSRAGLFAKVEVTRWRKAYIDGKCFIPAPA